ncbi:uncharacterized protein LOC122722005 [Manihot esculenta]|uniref:uncharacterized protein LOC122722005 n=1 Tax=Manihot esculenta TaxID=3983 RepID=UPI001CC3F1FB|nr:uncharacterized protein LOC122722005 [Manihot esculenta]
MLIMVLGIYMEIDAWDQSFQSSMDWQIEEACREENLVATGDAHRHIIVLKRQLDDLTLGLDGCGMRLIGPSSGLLRWSLVVMRLWRSCLLWKMSVESGMRPEVSVTRPGPNAKQLRWNVMSPGLLRGSDGPEGGGPGSGCCP